jgi:hypothetical protein
LANSALDRILWASPSTHVDNSARRSIKGGIPPGLDATGSSCAVFILVPSRFPTCNGIASRSAPNTSSIQGADQGSLTSSVNGGPRRSLSVISRESEQRVVKLVMSPLLGTRSCLCMSPQLGTGCPHYWGRDSVFCGGSILGFSACGTSRHPN